MKHQDVGCRTCSKEFEYTLNTLSGYKFVDTEIKSSSNVALNHSLKKSFKGSLVLGVSLNYSLNLCFIFSSFFEKHLFQILNIVKFSIQQ